MEWDAKVPINTWDSEIGNIFQNHAKELLNELKTKKLMVTLVPAPIQRFEGQMIRVVAERNPLWYREMYHSHSNFRRDNTLRALERISAMKDKLFYIDNTASPLPWRYFYDFLYRDLIFERLTQGYIPTNDVEDYGLDLKTARNLDISMFITPPNKIVCNYFNVEYDYEEKFYSSLEYSHFENEQQHAEDLSEKIKSGSITLDESVEFQGQTPLSYIPFFSYDDEETELPPF